MCLENNGPKTSRIILKGLSALSSLISKLSFTKTLDLLTLWPIYQNDRYQWCNNIIINDLRLLNFSHFESFPSKIINTEMFCISSKKMAVIFNRKKQHCIYYTCICKQKRSGSLY